MTRGLATLGLLLGIAGVATARTLPEDPDEPDNLPPPLPPPDASGPAIDREVSVTLSPFHALIPFLEITGELRITPNLSGALIAGIGKILDGKADKHSAQEFGAQATYYLKPTFRALHVGIEVTYVHSSDKDSATTFTGTSFAIGPFVGWKYIHRTGVTLLAQGGLALAFVDVRSPPDTEVTVLPIVNLNAGWSF
jgi:hypothetical protein